MESGAISFDIEGCVRAGVLHRSGENVQKEVLWKTGKKGKVL
jgi:hypothetical protein